MEDLLEFLFGQLTGGARGGDDSAPSPEPPAPPPAAKGRYPMPQATRRYPQPIVRGRPVPAPQQTQPKPPIVRPSAPVPQQGQPAPPSQFPAAAAPLAPPAPRAASNLLSAFSSRERLLGAIVLSEALAPPPGLRPRSPGGGF